MQSSRTQPKHGADHGEDRPSNFHLIGSHVLDAPGSIVNFVDLAFPSHVKCHMGWTQSGGWLAAVLDVDVEEGRAARS